MINANEARKLTSDSVMTILVDIDEGIRKAAKLGKYCYEYETAADRDTVNIVIKNLTDAGYTVSDTSSIGYDCEWKTVIKVEWKPTNKKGKK